MTYLKTSRLVNRWVLLSGQSYLDVFPGLNLLLQGLSWRQNMTFVLVLCKILCQVCSLGTLPKLTMLCTKNALAKMTLNASQTVKRCCWALFGGLCIQPPGNRENPKSCKILMICMVTLVCASKCSSSWRKIIYKQTIQHHNISIEKNAKTI